MSSWEPVAGLLASRRAARPDGIAAIGVDGTRHTWGELADRADALRSAVQGATRVGIWLPNRPDFAAAVFGAWSAGATAAMISGLASAVEATRLATTAACDVVITDRSRAGSLGDVRTIDLDGPLRVHAPAEEVALPADALVVFTSGTTGTPKGIVHTGTALLSSLRAMAASSGLDGDAPRPLDDRDRTPNLVLTPLAHVSGFLGLLFAWWAGKPILVFERFDPERLARAVEEHRITTLRLVPTMVYDLVHAPPSVRLPGVRYATCGTAALNPELARQFEARFGFPILANYGQSEAMGGVAAERLDDVRAGRRPVGSVGRPLPGVEVRIVDPETGAEVPTGEVGEILVRTRQVMRGYVGDRDRAPIDDDGFLHTGDLGRLDADGILSVVGRVRDVIVSGGFNIYPAEVEAVLEEAPGVDAAGVAARADERLGEVPVAAIVGDPDVWTPEAIDVLVRERLAPYKRPRAYVAVDALPRTANGKLDRARLAELVEASGARSVSPRS